MDMSISTDRWLQGGSSGTREGGTTAPHERKSEIIVDMGEEADREYPRWSENYIGRECRDR